jgi:hypothetical protein
MIQVKIDNKTYQINPELTVRRYQKIKRNPMKYENVAELLALYMDLEAEDVKNLPAEEIRYIEGLLTLHQSEPSEQIIFTFEHEGVMYGLENDWGNMTWGQWTDMEVMSQRDKIDDNIHILLALLYRPIKINKDGTGYTLEKFKSKEVMDRAQLMLDVPIQIWFGCATFFFLMSREYIINSKTSLERKISKEILKNLMWMMIPKFLRPKQRRGITLSSVMNSLKKISQRSKS